jgi:hypothetical protein
MEGYGGPWNTIKGFRIPLNTIKGHGSQRTPLRIMEGQVKLRRTIEGHGTPLRAGGPWNTIEGHRITLKPLKAMKGHLISWRAMEHHRGP